MNTDITKTIVFTFINKFTEQEIFTLYTPYLPFKAIDGYYSNMYKSMKDAAAHGFEKSLVRGKKYIYKVKGNRTIILLSSGIKLDMPYDVSKKDIKIIKHHIEGLKMSSSSGS